MPCRFIRKGSEAENTNTLRKVGSLLPIYTSCQPRGLGYSRTSSWEPKTSHQSLIFKAIVNWRSYVLRDNKFLWTTLKLCYVILSVFWKVFLNSAPWRWYFKALKHVGVYIKVEYWILTLGYELAVSTHHSKWARTRYGHCKIHVISVMPLLPISSCSCNPCHWVPIHRWHPQLSMLWDGRTHSHVTCSHTKQVCVVSWCMALTALTCMWGTIPLVTKTQTNGHGTRYVPNQLVLLYLKLEKICSLKEKWKYVSIRLYSISEKAFLCLKIPMLHPLVFLVRAMCRWRRAWSTAGIVCKMEQCWNSV
jgi:hypothetical protein